MYLLLGASGGADAGDRCRPGPGDKRGGLPAEGAGRARVPAARRVAADGPQQPDDQ